MLGNLIVNDYVHRKDNGGRAFRLKVAITVWVKTQAQIKKIDSCVRK